MPKKRQKTTMILLFALLSVAAFSIAAAYAAAITMPTAPTLGLGDVNIQAPFDVSSISFTLGFNFANNPPICLTGLSFTVTNVNPDGGNFEILIALTDSAGNEVYSTTITQTLSATNNQVSITGICVNPKNVYGLYIAARSQ